MAATVVAIWLQPMVLAYTALAYMAVAYMVAAYTALAYMAVAYMAVDLVDSVVADSKKIYKKIPKEPCNNNQIFEPECSL